ncbi:hypothetical protein EVAR_7289_1 [Eumeta japonica]|uniref:Uncharacterized protein n=1 Tax=Eumeta variegata TaxID=151549 RepID=A0A4C1T5G1_EUMVA|nr:hypothetical protein EVAR_7289_1 [Eumeta japonica]
MGVVMRISDATYRIVGDDGEGKKDEKDCSCRWGAMELLGSSLLHSIQRGEPLESTNPKLIYDSSYFLFFVFETVELDVVASSSSGLRRLLSKGLRAHKYTRGERSPNVRSKRGVLIFSKFSRNPYRGIAEP